MLAAWENGYSLGETGIQSAVFEGRDTLGAMPAS